MSQQQDIQDTPRYAQSDLQTLCLAPDDPASRDLSNQLSFILPLALVPLSCNSYMWADVMSSDAFEAFVEAGIDNEDVDHKLGRKFRDTFMASGGAVPPGEVFKRFRGRDPKVEPMLVYNGLA